MNIYLDNYIFSKTNNGGVSNYWFELTKYLKTNESDNLLYFEYEKDNDNFFRKKLKIAEEDIIKLKYHFFNKINRIEYKTNEKFIFHSSYYRRINNPNAIPVTTVHDFTHDYFFNYYKKKVHNYIKYSCIKEAKGIICISNSTYKDLKKFYKIKKNQKHTVIYNGVSKDYKPLENYSKEEIEFITQNELDKEFILFIGSRVNYKNFNFVVNVLNSNNKINLVIVGGGLLKNEEIKQFNNDSIKRITHLNNLDNDKLNILYNKAKALVYPSSYEGFGIPILEAMQAGCPVIGLNIPTNIEIAEKSIFLMNELSINEFNKIYTSLNNSSIVNDKINIGIEETKKYSWEKCTKETREFYQYLWD